MKLLWLISQTVNNGYDTYDSAVVACETEDKARLIHPSGYYFWRYDQWQMQMKDGSWSPEGHYGSWAHNPLEVAVSCIGIADPNVVTGVICASFNAG